MFFPDLFWCIHDFNLFDQLREFQFLKDLNCQL